MPLFTKKTKPKPTNKIKPMSKKQFIALADTIIRENTFGVPFYPRQIEALADFCAAQNPAFNRQRWLDYLAGNRGPGGGKVKTPAVSA